MNDLPEGWAWATVGEIANLASGPAFKSDMFRSANEGIRLLRGDNIEPGALRWANTKTWPEDQLPGYEHLLVSESDLILAMDRPLVSAGLKLAHVRASDVPALLVQRVARIRAKESVSAQYLLGALQGDRFIDHLVAGQTGTQLPHISLKVIGSFSIPLAPSQEQERIVTAIEEAFSKLDAGEAGLRAVRKRLQSMRASVLTSAVSGDWATASLKEVAWESGYGTSLKCSYAASGPGVLRIPNVQRGAIDLSDLKRAPGDSDLGADLFLAVGDVLIVRTNGSRDLIGRSAPVVSELGCSFASYLIRYRLRPEIVDARFVSFVLSAPSWRARLEASAGSSAGQYNLSLRALDPIPIPIPPLEEQARVVAEVERQLSFIGACERAVDAGLVKAAALRRSVLKAAFEGKLVEQDPGDEPASVLLERIRAERSSTPG